MRYNWVGKNICIFENLQKVIYLAWNITNALSLSALYVVDAVENAFTSTC